MRMLDLYCGEGLAAWGYWLSGRFSEIVGIDNNPEMRTKYSFDFVCADALTLDYEFLLSFDYIHASPPCQAYSHMTPDPEKHPRLIAATHLMLQAAGKPYCIENVEGAKKELKPNVAMNGHYFGLPHVRRRYFHVSKLEAAHRLIGKQRSQSIVIHGGKFIRRETLIEAFGLNCVSKQRLSCLTRTGIEQGIPPAFTRWIAETLFPHKFLIG